MARYIPVIPPANGRTTPRRNMPDGSGGNIADIDTDECKAGFMRRPGKPPWADSFS